MGCSLQISIDTMAQHVVRVQINFLTGSFFLITIIAMAVAFDSLLPNGNNYRRRVALRYKYAEQAINDFTLNALANQEENQTVINPYHQTSMSKLVKNPTFVTRLRLFTKIHFLTTNIADYVSSGLYFRITTALFSGCKFYSNEEFGFQDNSKLTYFRITFVKDAELKKYVYMHAFHTFDLIGLHQDELSFLKCKLRPNIETDCLSPKSVNRINDYVLDDFKKWFRYNSIIYFAKSYDVTIKKVFRRISFFSNFIHINYEPLPKCNQQKSTDVIFANTLAPNLFQVVNAKMDHLSKNSSLKLLREQFLDTEIPFVSNCPVNNKNLKEMMKEFRGWKNLRIDFSREEEILNVTEFDDNAKYSNLICSLNESDVFLLFNLWEIQNFVDSSFKSHLENMIRSNFDPYLLHENFFTLGKYSTSLYYARISIIKDNCTYHIASTFYSLRSKIFFIPSTNVSRCTLEEIVCTFENFHLPLIYDQNIKNYLRYKALQSFSPVL